MGLNQMAINRQINSKITQIDREPPKFDYMARD